MAGTFHGAGDRDVAASMSLLTQLLRNPLDAGYHTYGERGGSSPVWQKFVVCVLSAVLGVAGISAVSSLRSPSRVDVADSLGEHVRYHHEQTELLESQVDVLRGDIEAVTAGSGEQIEGVDGAMRLAIAMSEVTGPGVRVTVRSAPDSGVDVLARQHSGRVRDHDLRMIVNALWAAGAEALAINGKRIAPGSFIRTAGQSILVNITPIDSPYVIEAIGQGGPLSLALVQGETGDYLSSVESAHGITIHTQALSELKLPGIPPRAVRYSHVVKE